MAAAPAAGLFFIGRAADRSRYTNLLRESGMEWFDFARDKPERLSNATAVVLDLPLATVPEARKVRETLAWVDRTVPRLFVVDKNQRVEVVHAGVIGATAISSRPLVRTDLARFLGHENYLSFAGNGRPKASESTDSLQSIQTAAGSLESLFLAVTGGEVPDHARVYAACDEVATAVSHDGLGHWLDTVRSHHRGTLQHCLIVAGVLTRFGQAAGMTDKDVRMLTRVGLLHDVGKAVIPTELLDKPGKLSDEEFAVIKTHPYQGFKFLAKHGDVTQDVLSAVVGHHEYLDGSGYPYALAGRSIGDLVRITTICDIYGALVERRAYKAEMTPQAAIDVLDGLVDSGKVEGSLVQVLTRSVLS